MGVFMPVLRENEEMMYQFLHDYRFDSSKIETAFGLRERPIVRVSARRLHQHTKPGVAAQGT